VGVTTGVGLHSQGEWELQPELDLHSQGEWELQPPLDLHSEGEWEGNSEWELELQLEGRGKLGVGVELQLGVGVTLGVGVSYTWSGSDRWSRSWRGRWRRVVASSVENTILPTRIERGNDCDVMLDCPVVIAPAVPLLAASPTTNG
jgi:hypothetical protein